MGKDIIPGGPGRIENTRSLVQAIVAAKAVGHPLHIVFVHGIRAEGPGESTKFSARLAKELGATVIKEGARSYIDLGRRPNATMWGDSPGSTNPTTAIWRTEEEWQRSRPFVDHAHIAASKGDVYVHEVNYWPLLFPIKCRFLLAPEHELSGNDVEHLKLCKDWLNRVELDHLLHSKPKSGGGAKLNGVLKHQIMNWGLSDAVVALGPMRAYLNKTMDLAFAMAAKDTPPDQEYVVISESLGSFVVLDAYTAGEQSVRNVLDRTADLYMLANQLALLELARINGIPPFAPAAEQKLAETMPITSPMEALVDWASRSQVRNIAGPPSFPKQIVAFSDPSDLLTYRVPNLDGITVVNLYDRNERSFLRLFANPIKAHGGHTNNAAVWKVLMRTANTR